MSTPNAAMDAESLQNSGRRRGGLLDAFLVGSVVLLFAAVTTLAVVGVATVKDAESRLKLCALSNEPRSAQLTSGVSADAASTNFAYLEAHASDLKNATMLWTVPNKSLGSNFHFDHDNHWIKPKRSGIYFMYINLNLTCTHICKPVPLTIRVGDKMTCQVNLSNTTRVVDKCWAVTRVGSEQKLMVHMTVPKEGLKNWKLESSSGFGMFLVD